MKNVKNTDRINEISGMSTESPLNKRKANRAETPEESMEHIMMLLDILPMKGNFAEAEELRKEFMRIYRAYRRYEDAEALRTGYPKPQDEVLSVRELLQELAREMQRDALLRGFELRVESADSPEIFADREYIRRVLWNLLQNAAAAVNEKAGVIILKTQSVGEQCRISVLDNGAGFGESDPQEQYRIAPTLSGFGIMRIILESYGSALCFERAGEYTSVSFEVPIFKAQTAEFAAGESILPYTRGYSDAEIELSTLKDTE